MYINNALQYDRRSDIETSDIESIWIEMKLKKVSPFYYVRYLRRQSGLILFQKKFKKFTHFRMKSISGVILILISKIMRYKIIFGNMVVHG